MADTKITGLTADTAPTTDDLLVILDDPSGTPTTKKATIAALISACAMSSVTVQTLTSASGTYTPGSGMKKVLFILIGGGGGGGTADAADEVGSGGGGGGTVIALKTAAQVGASQSYAVGTGGSADSAGNNTTITGLSLTAGGGGAGQVISSTTVGTLSAAGTGGTATGGDLNIPGGPGGCGIQWDTDNGTPGQGGNSVLGRGGRALGTNEAGNAGVGYGGGGSGGQSPAGSSRAGGAGSDGVILAFEFLA